MNIKNGWIGLEPGVCAGCWPGVKLGMSKNPLRSGLLIPGDSVPSETDLKRLLLVFDRLSIAPEDDIGLFNDHEWEEDFSGGKISYTRRVPYVREPGFDESYHVLLEKTLGIRHDGLIRIMRVRVRSPQEARGRDIAYNMAISNAEMVRAAVPDRDLAPPDLEIPSGVYQGLYLTGQGGYEVNVPRPATLSGVDQHWEAVAWSRLGRAMKYVREASLSGHVPIALDEPNAGILLRASIGEVGAPIGPQNSIDTVLAWDLFDRERLDVILGDMTWKDVRRLRAMVLPEIRSLRKILNNSRKVGQGGIDDRRRALDELRREFLDAKMKLSESLTKSALGGALKVLLPAGVAVATTAMVVPALSWPGLLTAITVGGATMSREVKEYVVSRKKKISHPLFYLDKFVPIRP